MGERLAEALAVIDSAMQEHQPSHVFALFSGGHDSLASTLVAAQHPRFNGVVHVHTGIGIPATRTFVHETCARMGWPLKEYTPDAKQWEDLCLAKGMLGGTAQHNVAYYWLKQRQIRRMVQEHKTGRRDRIALVTGIRVQESARRMGAGISVPVRRQGAEVWINPILHWSAFDCLDLMAQFDAARNPVVDTLHRSGECLCGALAHHTELAEIAFWYPEVAARIRAMEQQCFKAGLPSRWGGSERLYVPPKEQPMLPLCASCETRWEAA